MHKWIVPVLLLLSIGAGPATEPTTAPSFPDSPLEAIQASLKASPPAKDEQWIAGPSDDEKILDQTLRREDLDPDIVRPAEHYTTVIMRTEIVSLIMRSTTADRIDIHDAAKRFDARLSGIISPDDLSPVPNALLQARAGPGARVESVGDKFTIRATVAQRSHFVRIELLWSDPDDPMVKHDWDLVHQQPSTRN